jgi:hypothetical protein
LSTSPVLAFEVTDPGLADLSACLKVLQNCPTPHAGAGAIRFDRVDPDIIYVIADRSTSQQRAWPSSSAGQLR